MGADFQNLLYDVWLGNVSVLMAALSRYFRPWNNSLLFGASFRSQGLWELKNQSAHVYEVFLPPTGLHCRQGPAWSGASLRRLAGLKEGILCGLPAQERVFSLPGEALPHAGRHSGRSQVIRSPSPSVPLVCSPVSDPGVYATLVVGVSYGSLLTSCQHNM